jgi:hypothetical protein
MHVLITAKEPQIYISMNIKSFTQTTKIEHMNLNNFTAFLFVCA